MTYTVSKVAERYRVNTHTVLQWIARGELAAFNVGRAPNKLKPRWRISEAALTAFEAARAAVPPAPAPRRKRAAAAGVVQFYGR